MILWGNYAYFCHRKEKIGVSIILILSLCEFICYSLDVKRICEASQTHCFVHLPAAATQWCCHLSVITSGGGTKWYSETAGASASWLCMLISTHMQQKTPASSEWWIFTSMQKKLPIAFRMIFGYYTPQISLWVILALLSLIWCVEWCNVLSFTSPNLTTCKIKMWWQCLLSC